MHLQDFRVKTPERKLFLGRKTRKQQQQQHQQQLQLQQQQQQQQQYFLFHRKLDFPHCLLFVFCFVLLCFY